ncbi:ROK family protein [Pontibacter liquoris]|uniref:ROK family protein n=1 Tax=Pontibacter liquoris TaxID=2905677 RepID=UPI001FA8040B|nr:ROK family protein [Pontibacter liquoris]
MNESIVLGVDIGGSHITAAMVDLERKAIMPAAWARNRVDAHGSAEEIIDTWACVMEQVLPSETAASIKIGIAIPGPFDYEGGISLIRNQNKYDALYGRNVKELLATRLGINHENILLVNDAGCFLTGEIFSGAAAGAHRAVGLTLGTGLGSARYRNGIGSDADLWRVPFKDAIAEEYLSTRAMVKSYQRLTGKVVDGVEELARLYEADPQVKLVFKELAENLACFIVTHLQQEKPDVIVIGGNIAKAWDYFIPETEKRLAAYKMPVCLRKAELGEAAVLIGAASYWQTEQV